MPKLCVKDGHVGDLLRVCACRSDTGLVSVSKGNTSTSPALTSPSRGVICNHMLCVHLMIYVTWIYRVLFNMPFEQLWEVCCLWWLFQEISCQALPFIPIESRSRWSLCDIECQDMDFKPCSTITELLSTIRPRCCVVLLRSGWPISWPFTCLILANIMGQLVLKVSLMQNFSGA